MRSRGGEEIACRRRAPSSGRRTGTTRSVRGTRRKAEVGGLGCGEQGPDDGDIGDGEQSHAYPADGEIEDKEQSPACPAVEESSMLQPPQPRASAGATEAEGSEDEDARLATTPPAGSVYFDIMSDEDDIDGVRELAQFEEEDNPAGGSALTPPAAEEAADPARREAHSATSTPRSAPSPIARLSAPSSSSGWPRGRTGGRSSKR